MKGIITKHGEERLGVPAGVTIEFDKIDQRGNVPVAEVVYDFNYSDYYGTTLRNISTVDEDAAVKLIK